MSKDKRRAVCLINARHSSDGIFYGTNLASPVYCGQVSSVPTHAGAAAVRALPQGTGQRPVHQVHR